MNEEREAVRQQQIIQAAIQVFKQKGYHDAKIAEIATVAGLGKGTIYQYYRSKEDLLEASLVHMMTIFENKFVDLAQNEITFEGKLRLLIRISLEQIDHIQPTVDLSLISVFNHLLLGQNIMLQHKLSWINRFSKMINEGVSQGQLRPVDPELFTSAVFGILFNICSPLKVMLHKQHDKQGMEDNIVDLIMRGATR